MQCRRPSDYYTPQTDGQLGTTCGQHLYRVRRVSYRRWWSLSIWKIKLQQRHISYAYIKTVSILGSRRHVVHTPCAPAHQSGSMTWHWQDRVNRSQWELGMVQIVLHAVVPVCWVAAILAAWSCWPDYPPFQIMPILLVVILWIYESSSLSVNVNKVVNISYVFMLNSEIRDIEYV